MSEYNVDEKLRTIFDSNDQSWRPADKIPLVTKEIEELKADLKIFISGHTEDIAAALKGSTELYAESASLVDKLKTFKEAVEKETIAEILKSIENHDKLSMELECVNFALNIVCDVIMCGNYVREFDSGREEQSFSRAIEAVYDLLQYTEVPVEGFQHLDLYTNTKNTAQLIWENLLHDLYCEWDRLICWTKEQGNLKTVITLTLNLDNSRPVIDVLNALDKSKKLKEKISEFSQTLLKDALIPIIHNECIVFAETDEFMNLTINHKPDYKPKYDAVISNLRLLFHYLSNKFNFDFGKNTTIMKMIGKEISIEFCEILVKDCLIETIPNNINELQTYGKITSEIEEFQRFLSIINFFNTEDYSILRYVKNIDILFADKSSQYFLVTARTIMLKDLSLTMSIGVDSIPENEELRWDDNIQAVNILNNTIPQSLFYFPRCMISKTAQELLDLVYMMMEQAVQCSDIVCKKLYNTTRLVFELYDAVVPYHHENYLQTIPQYVALFHNNCMFLAHSLLTLGDKWLVLMEGREMDYPISFVDLVQKLRDLGYKHLTVHMQQQRKQILDNIRSSDLNCIVVKDVLSDNAEAAIRQCLRQLQLLKNVWIGVYPSNVFRRLMATLVNMFVDELIHRVCTVEDISMEMATQLTEMYTLVIQKAPHLFQQSSDIETHVQSWPKLRELIFVLGGSLKDIENHWQDGKGPLKVFKTEELRNLVKALFQNTQIRANVLAKIK